ncbi:MAG TPA: hypothetical protein VFI73_05400 [Candidatus Nitrosopolaris sp.]|nr:hypothetical protein [Candidatus Nitrosopolaris sp.]
MQQSFRISLIAGLAIAIGLMMIPGVNIAPAAFASGHHHHHHHHGHHHHHNHGHHNNVSINQSVGQANVCDHSDCSNSASNSASIGSHLGSGNINVRQSIGQANVCSNSDCSNNASNTANIQ